MPAFIIRPSADLLKIHPELRHISHALALQYAFQEKVVTDKELENIGSRLWQAIGMTAGFNEARLQVGTAPLDIIIESDNPTIQQLPWETLHHPEQGFLGRHENFTLSRRLSATPITVPLRKEPLRVLLFSALPDDLDAETGRLNSEEEQAQVLEAFLPWIQEGKVKLETPEDGQFATLQANLDEFKPHLVFLSGHGKFHHEPHTGEAPYGTFLFEGENGESVAIPDGQIAQVFAGTSVQCVVLSACESGKSASVELNNGLSYQLAAQGIPQVVGMRESIMDVAGIQFARAFCDGLLAAQGVGQALQAARMAITQPLKDEYQGNARYKLLAELSYGQWCLPSLLSQDPASLLVDWDFIAEPLPDYTPHIRLENITLPQQFFGRRRELRELRRMIRANASGHVLVTGAGGMGKTALAGKLADSLRKQGYHVFAWSAANPETWVALAQQMVETLQYHNKEEFERESKQNQAPADYARLLLRLVMRQHDNRAVVFLDNLESVQDSQTLATQHPELQAWLDVAHSMGRDAPHFILTSRWKMSEWADDAHYQLITPLYGDFLQFAQRQNLPKDFLKQRDFLQQLYTTFGGNFRALEFFSCASKGMDLTEEQAFLKRLKGAEAEIQTNMAIAELISGQSDEENRFLCLMTVYPIPVPIEGLQAIWNEKHNFPIKNFIERSLVNVSFNSLIEQPEYQVVPLVRNWIANNNPPKLNEIFLQKAARFLLQQVEKNRNNTLYFLHVTYHLLLVAKLIKQAQRLVLDWIVDLLNNAGGYCSLLNDWLIPLAQAEDVHIRADVIGQIGRQYFHVGQYDLAIDFLEKSLVIQQRIGNKFGENTTLNNMGSVAYARGDYDDALEFFEKSLVIQKENDNDGTVLNNISQVFKAKGDYDSAIIFLEKYLEVKKRFDDKIGIGVALNNMALIFSARGDYDSALDYLNKSLLIRRQIKDKYGIAVTLNNIALILNIHGDYNASLDFLKRSLAIQEDIGDKYGASVTLNNISQIYNNLGNYEISLGFLEKALAIQRKIGDKSGEGVTLNNMATIIQAHGDYDAALVFLEKSLNIQQTIGDKAGEGMTLNNISQIHDICGDYKKALDLLEKSLAIHKEIGDKIGEGTVLNNMALIFKSQDNDENALDFLNESLVIQKNIGHKFGEARTLNNIYQW